MGLRRVIGGILLIIAGIVIGDRLLRRLAGDLSPPRQGALDTVRVSGFDVSYVEWGSPDDDDILLVHDVYIGASNAEFEALGEALSNEYHVIAIDLPGFGRSERPPIEYDIGIFAHALETVIEERMDEPIIVASGLGATFALETIQTTSVERFIAISPRERRWPPAVGTGVLLDVPIIGTGLYDLLSCRPSLSYHLEEHLGCGIDQLPAGFVDYTWRSAHQSGARHAIGAWLAGDLDSTVDLLDTIERTDLPVTLVGGEPSIHPEVGDLREIATTAQSTLITVDNVGHAPHLCAPELLATHLIEDALTG